MADQQAQHPNPDAAAKDPDEWVTGDEPVTAAQQSYLQTLAREAGEAVPDGLSKADASKLIDELQRRTGRDATPQDGPTSGSR